MRIGLKYKKVHKVHNHDDQFVLEPIFVEQVQIKHLLYFNIFTVFTIVNKI